MIATNAVSDSDAPSEQAALFWAFGRGPMGFIARIVRLPSQNVPVPVKMHREAQHLLVRF